MTTPRKDRAKLRASEKSAEEITREAALKAFALIKAAREKKRHVPE